MINWAHSQVLCLIHNCKDSHLLMVSYATQPYMETPSQRARMWTPAVEQWDSLVQESLTHRI